MSKIQTITKILLVISFLSLHDVQSSKRDCMGSSNIKDCGNGDFGILTGKAGILKAKGNVDKIIGGTGMITVEGDVKEVEAGLGMITVKGSVGDITVNNGLIKVNTLSGLVQYPSDKCGRVNVGGSPVVCCKMVVACPPAGSVKQGNAMVCQNGKFLSNMGDAGKSCPKMCKCDTPTSAVPGTNTAAPVTSTTAPGINTAAPSSSTAAPGTNTAAPGTNSASRNDVKILGLLMFCLFVSSML